VLWSTFKLPETENAMEGKMQKQAKIEMVLVGGPPPSLDEIKKSEMQLLQMLIEMLKADLK
jgi:hypothetical protein